MKLTEHAKKRMNQRAISNDVLDMVISLGTFLNAKGRAEKIFFGKKQSQQVIGDLKRLIKIVERAKNTTLIIADSKIITCYKTY